VHHKLFAERCVGAHVTFGTQDEGSKCSFGQQPRNVVLHKERGGGLCGFWGKEDFGMREVEQALFFRNAVETLGYFSEQIAAAFREQGIKTYFIDHDDLVNTVDEALRFISRGETVLCTFNFVGLSGEEVFLEENGRYIWENRRMRCLNIIVDHPLYYHSKFVALSKRMREQMQIFCIDRTHVAYFRRYYPEFEVAFLPLAGNRELHFHDDMDKSIKAQTMQREVKVCPDVKEWLSSRPYDLVFTGNFTPVGHLYSKIDECEPDYRKFYHEIMDDLLAKPSQTMDEVMERHIKNELGEVSSQDARSAMAGMVFVDICVRSYFRENLIRNLAENDIKVHVFGANWEKLSCSHPENIISSGKEVDSLTCLRAIRDSKIALNIQPWFKDGAHDRVFTAMLQGAVSLTDDSRYLREQFADGEELVFFSLEHANALPALIRELLEQPEQMRQIAKKGQDKALAHHTWRNRAQELLAAMK
jgi:hypothetical protein